MKLSQEPICISSYNSTGLGLGTIKFVETLLLFSTILCLPERFLQDAGDKKHSNTNIVDGRFFKIRMSQLSFLELFYMYTHTRAAVSNGMV